MKKISKILLLFFLSFLFLFYSNAKNISKNGSYIIKNDIKKTKAENINLKSAYNVSFGNIPLYFIQNKGQFNKKALFYARTSKYFIWITKKGLIFDSVRKNKIKNQQKHQYKRDVSRLLFKGANKSPEIVPIDTTNYRVNYFTRKDKSKWETGISTSKAVMYKNIYPHIDLKVYGKEKQIEYDWIVKPGGNPCNIRFEFKDVKGTELDNKGNIIITTEFGKIIHKRPLAYQNKNNKIDVRFKKLSKNSYTFNIGKYNKTEKLIIDPLVLLYSTYLGGRLYDKGNGIAVDSSGCAYVTGYTESKDFPLQNPYQANSNSPSWRHDAFITKLNSTGDGLIYSTYIGGNKNDRGVAIAVDAKGYAYITGYTDSSDFPLQNPYMNYKKYNDVFVTKLSTDGQSLIYSTYLGGWSGDGGYGIAVDSSGSAYVTGYTRSSDFPLQNPYQANYQESCDIFITKLNPTGDGLIYSTYLGGECHDEGNGIAVDSSGSAYVTGTTSSLDFPLQNPYQANSQIWKFDAFITKLNLKDLVVRASVSGGNGSATPSTQSIAYGSNALITITPALGYEIASITDNSISQTIINPYIIENVTEDHLVIVSFKLSIRLSMTGVKKTERAWIIKRDYGELNILVTNPWGIEYTYIIQRSEDGGGFQDIKTLSSSEISGGTYTYYDKYLGKNIVYTYRFIAKDSSGNIIALSNEISI